MKGRGGKKGEGGEKRAEPAAKAARPPAGRKGGVRSHRPRAVKVGRMEFPLDRLYYTRKGAHLWLRVERGGLVRIGMDSFLTELAGHLSYITLAPAKRARKGGSLGSFESAKFVSKIHSPVTGSIAEVNQRVLKDPRLINRQPYDAWILAVKPDNLERDLSSADIVSDPRRLKEWIQKELRSSEEG